MKRIFFLRMLIFIPTQNVSPHQLLAIRALVLIQSRPAMLIYGSGDWFIDLIKRPQILETSFVRLRHSSKPITFIAGRHFSLFTAIFLGFVFSMIFLSDFCFFPFTSTHKPWPSSTGPRVFSLSLVAQLRFFPFDTLHNFPTSITRTSFVRHYRQKSIPEGHGSDSWKKKKIRCHWAGSRWPPQ